ncbi:MAG: type II secretion system protein [Huintestinicola sp.]
MKRLKGFTLAELIISFVLLAGLMAVSCAMLFSSEGMLLRQADSVDIQRAGTGICSFVRDKLTYAVDIGLSDIPDMNGGEYEELLFIKDGRVCIAEVDEYGAPVGGTDAAAHDIFSSEYYCGLIAEGEIVYHEDRGSIDILIRLTEKHGEEPEFEQQITVYPMNAADSSIGSISAVSGQVYSSGGGKDIYIKLNIEQK